MFVRTCSVAQEDGESELSTIFLATAEPSTACGSFREEKQKKYNVFVLRKLRKLKKLARFARLEKLKANSLAVELGAGSTPRPKGIGF